MSQPTRFDKAWYDYLEEVAGAFYAAISVVRARLGHTTPLSPLLTVRAGYAESPGWFMVQAAEFDPEPLTVQNLRVRDVYGSEKLVRALLELMASEKWFDRSARDEYALTDTGREMLSNIFARRRSWLEQLTAQLPAYEHLAQTLRRLIDAGCELEQAWCVQHSRRRAPLQEISSLGVIFQAFEDVNAARDDAHMAAWQPTGATGQEWETFTFVADETATTAGALFDQLHYRGFTRAEYADTLNALAWRGWLERAGDETYRVTAKGRELRAEVEQKTDTIFYAPWQTLSESELAEFYNELESLQKALSSVTS